MHALTVILGLMYIPFGKLFHIFQRPGNLGVAYYTAGERRGPAAVCRRCGEEFASAQQIADLQAVLPEVGFDYDDRRRRELPGHLPGVPSGQRDLGAVGAGRGVRLMARPPISDEELIAAYGPHLNQAPPGGWDAGLEVDRVVETHCCFCGQQCGIKLKVHDNEVVGFEPWYDFPFNEGKLCPKGVKRYLQGSHPDRLLHPMERDPDAPGRVPARDVGRTRSTGWSSEIRRIQAAYGDDAFAMLSGVSLTNEKSYLIGKFARLALHTANLDYNGRYCMVSAGAGNKKALGVDRAPNPWSDIPLADVVWVAGSNVAETFPITTSYIWRARDRGARLIVQDPRVVPARPHRRSVPPGAARQRLGALRRGPARADPPRLARPRVHRRPHRRLRPGRRRRRRHDAAVGR